MIRRQLSLLFLFFPLFIFLEGTTTHSQTLLHQRFSCLVCCWDLHETWFLFLVLNWEWREWTKDSNIEMCCVCLLCSWYKRIRHVILNDSTWVMMERTGILDPAHNDAFHENIKSFKNLFLSSQVYFDLGTRGGASVSMNLPSSEMSASFEYVRKCNSFFSRWLHWFFPCFCYKWWMNRCHSFLFV